MMKTIFEKSIEGQSGIRLSKLDVPKNDTKNIDSLLRRDKIGLPEVSEFDTIRHFTQLSNRNFGVDSHFYPLGSCTMKYNPRINEFVVSNNQYTNVHPYQEEEDIQGYLEVLYNLQDMLSEITGLPYISLQPAAGAHGEFAGMSITRKYFEVKGDTKRNKIIVPESAHGTNPASAAMVGWKIISVKANEKGTVDIEHLKSLVDDTTACIMLTNPNTLGIWEDEIQEISKIMHECGALLYYDGANMNAIAGKIRPGDMGFDIIHLNLHKTFSTPHGGGGPGAGPIGVSERLKDFIPSPYINKKNDKYFLDYDIKNSIGKLRTFYGNTLVLLKAYAYILAHGKEGIPEMSEIAVLNANYLKEKLKKLYDLPFDRICMHEFVLSIKNLNKEKHIAAYDIAKRLLDYDIHPPTVYFPLIVNEAMMIEPTESESKATLDEFVDIMTRIRKEIDENPDLLHEAPHNLPVCRLREADAVKNPRLVHKES